MLRLIGFVGRAGRETVMSETLFDLPDDFTHPDGSTGDLFRCPACNKRLMATAT